ncbi:hypothetical protein DXG03_009443 [Asterophora parasitica]|uniref:Ricin B lectin domain-containing protein n=1 Tax=Asterophora parasitica TaxID=117018 RepID=A0A9P7KH64_9AGAR|nr:hypothetical protein DXG03_009443 [Asterophora parasitica]
MGIEHGNNYILQNGKSGTVLDLSGSDGYSILGWEGHSGDNQRWTLENHDNRWVFRNVGTGRYLGYNPDDLRDDAPVFAVDEPVAWDIWPDEGDDTVHRISVPGTPFTVDLTNFGSEDNGTPVALWGKWEGRNQTWRFLQGE